MTMTGAMRNTSSKKVLKKNKFRNARKQKMAQKTLIIFRSV